MASYDDYPFLNFAAALEDCDTALSDMAYYVETMQADTEGHLPPEAATLLSNIAATREMLGWLFPPAMQQAIAEEQARWDEDAERWEPSSY